MIKQPPYLKKGDRIAIVCPAKKLPRSIEKSIQILESWGLEVVTGKTVAGSYNQFAGTDPERTNDLQQYLDDPEIRAVFAGRGGYGTLRIIDQLDFSKFNEHPKWVTGFSDITILLSHILASCGTQSIHGHMPYTFDDATPASLDSLHAALFGSPLTYKVPGHLLNIPGNGSGVVIGGNLTLLAMVQGSVSEMDYAGKILFLEDVGEHEYSIDRMMRMLKRSGKLAKLKGMIAGAFNEIKKEDIFFGETPEQIIKDLTEEYDYPVCFNFPVGHIDHNLSLVVGRSAALSVGQDEVSLTFLQP